MRPRSVVTCLPSRNLEQSLMFYRDCFQLPDLKIEEDTLEIELGNLSLFVMSVESFEQYTQPIGMSAGFPRDKTEVIHSCAVDVPEDLDHIFATAEGFGGSIAKAMHTSEWGQELGYIRDPDGHLWEMVLVAIS